MMGKRGGGLFNKMAALTWVTKERERERAQHTHTSINRTHKYDSLYIDKIARLLTPTRPDF